MNRKVEHYIIVTSLTANLLSSDSTIRPYCFTSLNLVLMISMDVSMMRDVSVSPVGVCWPEPVSGEGREGEKLNPD